MCRVQERPPDVMGGTPLESSARSCPILNCNCLPPSAILSGKGVATQDVDTLPAGLSNSTAALFGKPGRPANDPVRERLRIYRAAGPLILESGVRGTTIKSVARAAWLSPGGIYHYFGSKRQLVLYGLEPEALSRACSDSTRELMEAVSSTSPPDPAHLVDLYVEKNVRMLEFVRPALQAAIELGRSEMRTRLSDAVRRDSDWLVSALRTIHPGLEMADDSADAIRRTILGLALDDSLPPSESRRQLLWLFRSLVPHFPR